MKVCVYQGSLGLVEKSGVGQAVWHQMRALSLAGATLSDLRDPDTAVVQINTVFPDAVRAAAYARRRGKKVLWYGHSTEEDFRNSFRLSNALAPLFKKWITRCYSMADAILTPTEYSREILLGYGIQNPIFVLSNGVDTDFFKPDPIRRARFRNQYQIGPEQKVVLSVGHYMVRKGILDFLDLAARMPDVRFFWFGHTGRALMTEEVERAIAHASPNVCFPGFAPQEALCDAYCGSDLFCFMSHEETEGIVVLEALASKIPVLVRDIPVYRGWLTDGGNVYKADAQEAFYTLIPSFAD